MKSLNTLKILFVWLLQCNYSKESVAPAYKSIIQLKQGNRNCSQLYDLPAEFPCEWMNNKIPYVFNFFAPSVQSLISVVEQGIEHIEHRSCLGFKEYNPVLAAKDPKLTYLYFTYSGVLEDCCQKFYRNPYGRRVLLISPLCKTPSAVAHVILHGIGLTHKPKEPFSISLTRNLLFASYCNDSVNKIEDFDRNLKLVSGMRTSQKWNFSKWNKK